MRRAVALALAACSSPSGAPPRRAPPAAQFALADLVGEWRWALRTTEAGTTRIEEERWQLRPAPDAANQLVGRYLRTTEVRSTDGAAFACNQRPSYRQRAAFDIRVDLTATGFAIRETAYRAEPSPCDHGFRHLGAYTAELAGARLRLRWDGGEQTLWHTAAGASPTLAADPWPTTPSVLGSWRWDASSFDDEGRIHDESEWWQITRRSETQVDATYRRRVTVRSADGAPIACANAASWSFDDAYVLDGRREDEHWHFYERAADPGDHPCLRTTPRRHLDEATAEQRGDSLVFEWRGKRRQVLYRDEPAARR